MKLFHQIFLKFFLGGRKQKKIKNKEQKAGNGARVEMSKFDYPKLSTAEIITILAESEIAVITDNDLKNPNQDFVSDLYTRLLIYLDILHE